MTTQFSSQSPNFFSTKEAAEKHKTAARVRSNHRYSRFTQMYFTAGDKNQFILHSVSEQTIGIKMIKASDTNIFTKHAAPEELQWPPYRNMRPEAISNTFNYMFDKYKKGIFISIRDNQLDVFLPFSNVNYRNQWTEFADFSIPEAIECIKKSHKGPRTFNPKSVNTYIDQWYCNNSLVRFEYPIKEGDSGLQQIADMFTELCKNREIPDVDFFVNKRDFPMLKLDHTESYEEIYGSSSLHDTRHAYADYCPIFSMTSTAKHADIPIPTWEDWTRVESQNYGKFFSKPIRDYRYTFNLDWETKIPTAIFRGSSTGCGVTVDTNPRLKLAQISHQHGNKSFIDAGITSWNLRPRLVRNERTGKLKLKTIEPENLDFGLVDQMSAEEQSNYRYIINVDGHVTSYRLSLELSMGSVIFLVESRYYIWFMKYMEPWVHYIPVNQDMSDLIDKIKWARQNDEECKKIAVNALEFYLKYLTRQSIFDYLQYLLINVTIISGNPFTHKLDPRALTISRPDSYFQELKLPVELQLPKTITYNVLETISRVIHHMIDTMPTPHSPSACMDYMAMHLFQTTKYIFSTKTNRIQVHSFDKHSELLLSKTLKCCDIDDPSNPTDPSDPSDPSNATPELFTNTKIATEQYHEKLKEFKHAYNVGISLNKLATTLDNFAITMGIYCPPDESNVPPVLFLQNIKGVLFSDWLKSREFCLPDYYSIVLQLAFALSTAFRLNGFVHNDLYPWNIIIKTYPRDILVGYRYGGKQFSIKTKLVPVIIDYGKANIIIDDHYYRYNEKSIELQDIVTLIVSTTHLIVSNQQIKKPQMQLFLKFCNFIASTQYTHYKKFVSLKELKQFTFLAKKYDEIINSVKGELSSLSYNSFINFMLLNFIDLKSGTVYLTDIAYRAPNINIDNILIGAPDQNPIKQITMRYSMFLTKTIEHSTKINCLQFVKYYQNLWSSFEYLRELADDFNSLRKTTPAGAVGAGAADIKELDRLYCLGKEKILDKWAEFSPKFTKPLKIVRPPEFKSTINEIDSSLDVVNIDKAIALLNTFDFSIYTQIHKNKLLLNTFDEVQYFSGCSELKLPQPIAKYYKKVIDNDTHGSDISSIFKKHLQNKQLVESNIATQYLHMIYDKTIFKQLYNLLQYYEKVVKRVKAREQESPTIPSKDYIIDDKIIEYGKILKHLIAKKKFV